MIVKLVMLSVTGIVLAVLFKSSKPEMGFYIGFALMIVIGGYIAEYLGYIKTCVNDLKQYLKVGEGYIGILLKAVGVVYLCEFGAAICKDAGYMGVAGQIEMAGKLYIVIAGMPILLALLECIENLAV